MDKIGYRVVKDALSPSWHDMAPQMYKGIGFGRTASGLFVSQDLIIMKNGDRLVEADTDTVYIEADRPDTMLYGIRSLLDGLLTHPTTVPEGFDVTVSTPVYSDDPNKGCLMVGTKDVKLPAGSLILSYTCFIFAEKEVVIRYAMPANIREAGPALSYGRISSETLFKLEAIGEEEEGLLGGHNAVSVGGHIYIPGEFHA